MSKKKTFRVGGPQSPSSISSSFIFSFVLLPFFLNTKMNSQGCLSISWGESSERRVDSFYNRDDLQRDFSFGTREAKKKRRNLLGSWHRSLAQLQEDPRDQFSFTPISGKIKSCLDMRGTSWTVGRERAWERGGGGSRGQGRNRQQRNDRSTIKK